MPGINKLWTVAPEQVQSFIQVDIVIRFGVNSVLLDLDVGVDVIGPNGVAVVGMRGDVPFGEELLFVERTGLV